MAVDTVRLAEARLALHQLATGAMAASITDQNGDRVEYSKANMKDLLAYIAVLEAGGTIGQSRPLGFVF